MSSHQTPHDDILDADDDDELLGTVPPNPHASATRWRHQESAAFAKHAGRAAAAAGGGSAPHHHHHHHAVARDPEARSNVNDLADFLNSSRVSPDELKNTGPVSASATAAPRFKPIVVGAEDSRESTRRVREGEPQEQEEDGTEIQRDDAGHVHDGREIACGPLLNYRRTEGDRWCGSVLVVTKGGGKTQAFVPVLELRKASDGDNAHASEPTTTTTVEGTCLYSDRRNTFWRFDVSVRFDERAETSWEYGLRGLRFASRTKPRVNRFFVPAAAESMRIMFHSCNGFSVGTDEAAWSGPALWNDVMRRHRAAPFHVMIGGGDQIYNDGIRVSGPLRPWTDIGNPKKRRDYPFPETLRQDCDDYYLKNYIRWYGTEPFAQANGQIPQLNIWDDHDIIDGFGSYVNEFMKCDVFRGIGGTAHKYYMLFQHHLPPPPSTYTTDDPSSTTADGQGSDPNQLIDTYVHPKMIEPSYIIGSKPGPYVAEHSHNMFARLGARIAFLGIDARTERTRHQVNYHETYDQIFARLKDELSAAISAGNPYRHLILLLGIPVAYPRLTWLENIFSSPLMGPVKLLNRRLGFAGGFFNQFDGSVDLLDDLDDHYTARTHKKERNHLVGRLQRICAEFSVRITILGGDVHLAALGRFYSNPDLEIPADHDYRYMVNVISSAIVNKPPPQAVANLLARRNKIHHLDGATDETLLGLFDKDPGETTKTAGHNHVTMPSRNFAMITENSPYNETIAVTVHHSASPATHLAPPPHNNNNTNGTDTPANANGSVSVPPGSSAGLSTRSRTSKLSKASHHATMNAAPGTDGHWALHPGEVGAGSNHKAASPELHGRGTDGGLDVCICVEQDQHDAAGHTQGYGLTIPLLRYEGPLLPSAAPESVAEVPEDALGSAVRPGTNGEEVAVSATA